MRAQSYLIGLVAVGALAFWGVNKMSRGIRNKNPLNIERTGDQWLGMAQDQSSDSRFVVFDHEVYGIRAAARIIKNYGLRGVDTIQEIISTWAPESENDTANYVAIVVEKTGIPPLRPISDEEIPALLAAMIVVENGNNPYSMELIAEGVRLANVS